MILANHFSKVVSDAFAMIARKLLMEKLTRSQGGRRDLQPTVLNCDLEECYLATQGEATVHNGETSLKPNKLRALFIPHVKPKLPFFSNNT